MTDLIMVVGAGGFIGRALVRSLEKRGQPVLAVMRETGAGDVPPSGHRAAEPVDQAGYARLLARCRAVVHVASRSTPGSSAGRALEDATSNLLPLLRLLEAMQEHPRLPLLFMSSSGSLYDSVPFPGADETAALRPRSYHGAGKVAAEYYIRAWADQFGGAATLLRPTNVYGPGQLPRKGFGIIPAAMESLRQNEAITIWGDGSSCRDYLYIDDLVDLCIRLLAGPMPPGARAMNAASGTSVSVVEVLSRIEAVAERPLIRRFGHGRTVDAPSIRVDPSLAQRETGWKAATDLDEGLRLTWQWSNTASI
jgi:UDP-glucose 4-epimerase